MPPEIKPPEEVMITILDRSEITTYPTLEKEVKVMSITFTATGIPPLTVRIPKEEYSAERETEEIKKAIKEYKEIKPEIKRVIL
jgi:hypothetical protein